MPTTTLVPTSTAVEQWDYPTPGSNNHHLEIDEGTGSPGADYIETYTAGDVDEFGLTDTPADCNTVEQITVNVNGYLDDSGATARLQVNVRDSGDSDITGSPFYIDGSGTPGNFSAYGTSAETVSRTLTGLSLSKATADGLKVRVTKLAS